MAVPLILMAPSDAPCGERRGGGERDSERSTSLPRSLGIMLSTVQEMMRVGPPQTMSNLAGTAAPSQGSDSYRRPVAHAAAVAGASPLLNATIGAGMVIGTLLSVGHQPQPPCRPPHTLPLHLLPSPTRNTCPLASIFGTSHDHLLISMLMLFSSHSLAPFSRYAHGCPATASPAADGGNCSTTNVLCRSSPRTPSG